MIIQSFGIYSDDEKNILLADQPTPGGDKGGVRVLDFPDLTKNKIVCVFMCIFCAFLCYCMQGTEVFKANFILNQQTPRNKLKKSPIPKQIAICAYDLTKSNKFLNIIKVPSTQPKIISSLKKSNNDTNDNKSDDNNTKNSKKNKTNSNLKRGENNKKKKNEVKHGQNEPSSVYLCFFIQFYIFYIYLHIFT